MQDMRGLSWSITHLLPIKYLFTENVLKWSILRCKHCTDQENQDNYFCYGTYYISSKIIFWRISFYSENFLTCPGYKCAGDPNFFRDNTESYCESCLFSGAPSVHTSSTRLNCYRSLQRELQRNLMHWMQNRVRFRKQLQMLELFW